MQISESGRRKRLLWIGDAVASTGFARCTHKTLDVLCRMWDVTVLGINYSGDPHSWPYKIFPAFLGGDAMGVKRTKWVVDAVKPDVIIVQNDLWNVPAYIDEIREAGFETPVVATMPVDGKNARGSLVNKLAHAIFWTQFGLDEARAGGYTGPATVIPLGIDLEQYQPMERLEARRRVLKIPEIEDVFIVGNVNRNQPRKRLDLTISYFCEWINTRGIEDAYLFLHVAPTGDVGYNVRQLMAYYMDKRKRLIVCDVDPDHGIDQDLLAATYSCFDVQLSTTQGEGWGLTTMEGMACGVPQVVPDWAALGEWCGDAAVKVPIVEIACTPNNINAIGGIASRDHVIDTLDWLYKDELSRKKYGERGHQLVQDLRFSWETIGQQFDQVLKSVVK